MHNCFYRQRSEGNVLLVFVCSRRCIPACTWAEVCVGTGMYTPPPPPQMATDAVGTYPTGLHSCDKYKKLSSVRCTETRWTFDLMKGVYSSWWLKKHVSVVGDIVMKLAMFTWTWDPDTTKKRCLICHTGWRIALLCESNYILTLVLSFNLLQSIFIHRHNVAEKGKRFQRRLDWFLTWPEVSGIQSIAWQL